ncbi:unnamed protein product, partial [Laminaria digitata]
GSGSEGASSSSNRGATFSLGTFVEPHVFPPGVDPFVTPIPDGGLSPPLSPRAGVVARGTAPAMMDRDPASAAPSFALAHLPPPQHSPPPLASRQRAPPSPTEDDELSLAPEAVNPLHPPLVLWPPPSSQGEGLGVSVG